MSEKETNIWQHEAKSWFIEDWQQGLNLLPDMQVFITLILSEMEISQEPMTKI